MMPDLRRFILASVVAVLSCGPRTHAPTPPADPGRSQITVLYDSFGPQSALIQDWGYAALIEHDGKRVLFDTGNDAATFEHNARELGIDLSRLDAVVISHQHEDHTRGLAYVRKVNPAAPVYLPWEAAPGTTEVLPGFFVIPTRSRGGMPELSLAVRTAEGLVVVTGCSHSGVDNIVREAKAIDREIRLVAGGFHLLKSSADEIRELARRMEGPLGVGLVAPGHCTSEPGFEIFAELYGGRFRRAGLGEVVYIASTPGADPDSISRARLEAVHQPSI